MATVTNWIDHLSAAEVQGAIYPGVGTEGMLVIAFASNLDWMACYYSYMLNKQNKTN